MALWKAYGTITAKMLFTFVWMLWLNGAMVDSNCHRSSYATS